MDVPVCGAAGLTSLYYFDHPISVSERDILLDWCITLHSFLLVPYKVAGECIYTKQYSHNNNAARNHCLRLPTSVSTLSCSAVLVRCVNFNIIVSSHIEHQISALNGNDDWNI